MTKAKAVRSSEIQFDGTIPLVVNSPAMTLHTAQANQGSFVAPCNGTIVAIEGNLIEAPGTAADTIDIGTRANDDALVAAYSIATSDATGSFNIPLDDATVISLAVSKGDVIEFTTHGAATTTGIVALSVVIMPEA
jgi:hypothetical protein